MNTECPHFIEGQRAKSVIYELKAIVWHVGVLH